MSKKHRGDLTDAQIIRAVLNGEGGVWHCISRVSSATGRDVSYIKRLLKEDRAKIRETKEV